MTETVSVVAVGRVGAAETVSVRGGEVLALSLVSPL